MGFIKDLALLACILTISFFTCTHAATFDITNRCSYTVWAAASPGGGRRLNTGQSWRINVAPGTVQARIWGRTNCNFDGNGRGQCQTGDCNGLLECRGYGRPPNTLAEFALNQFSNLDFVDISLVDGFNVPMEFSPTTNVCQNLRCTGRINEECPNVLRAPGGCNNPCTVFGTNQYCCTNGLEAAARQIIRGFLSRGALMLIAILRMIRQVFSLALLREREWKMVSAASWGRRGRGCAAGDEGGFRRGRGRGRIWVGGAREGWGGGGGVGGLRG
ncbi:UNVERIFIED_CONTAM: Thaumatin-like protein [Sesamum radiatum]|uniref:Thaumatin-like protein n=1 Tax=Sesamum radiatum TaxID=300843 RepID=A0AAW2JUY3_SESRA